MKFASNLEYPNSTMERKLYEASLTGNVQVFNELLKEDQLILDRISLTSFNQTPLHIAALHGHLHFTRHLLNHKPTLYASLDSLRRTPLHLACSKGHVEVVKELLNVRDGPNICNLPDQDGKSPLYLAAMNGHLEVIKVLIQARPEIAWAGVDQWGSVLQMCVRNNCFEALQVLIEFWRDEDVGKVIDSDGNTLLHLSAMHKQTETVKYLLHKSSFLANENAVNGHGFTALDVLDHSTKDVKTLEIREILIEAGIKRAKNRNPLPRPLPLPSPYPSLTQESSETKPTKDISNSKHKQKGFLSRLFKTKSSDWLEKERGNLVIAATIFAAITYHAGIHPPGGKFFDSTKGSSSRKEISMNNFSQILALVASLTSIVILVGGFNLKNKFVLWLLLQGMLTIFVFLTVTYLVGIANMSPDSWVNVATLLLGLVWIIICSLYGFISTIYFAVRAIRKRLAKRRMERGRGKNENPVYARTETE